MKDRSVDRSFFYQDKTSRNYFIYLALGGVVCSEYLASHCPSLPYCCIAFHAGDIP